MFKNLFRKKEVTKVGAFFAPMTDAVKKIEDVPDPTFVEKKMGGSIAIEPTEGLVVARCNGEVIQVFPTKHAFGIQSESGIELLIHIGLETVSLDGEGFETFVNQGDQVKTGDKLVEVDLDIVREKADGTITPMVLTNGDMIDSVEKMDETESVAGTTKLLHVHLK